MLSMPPAATMLLSPVRICWAASATERRPEPQSWLMLKAVFSSGMPAARAAWRAGSMTLASGKNLAEDQLVHVRGRDAGALERAFHRDGGEFMRGQRAQRAVEAADRRAGGGCDNDVGHVGLSLTAP